MENNNQHKRYQWYLQFDEITWRATYGDECPPFVNEENKEGMEKILESSHQKSSQRGGDEDS